MNDKKLTFSRQVKDELSHLSCANTCCRQAELAAAVFGAGRITDHTITLFTGHAGSADRLADLIKSRSGQNAVWQTGRELVSLVIDQPAAYQAVCADLKQLFGFDPTTGVGRECNCKSPCCRQAILRALFLACGSISEPSTAYHLELSTRRPDAARMAADLLTDMDIRPGILHRNGHDVVYLKEGQHIADFLLQTGAHQSMLSFESLRVDKEMNNSVNRMVNCDSANTQRMANSSARQLDLIRQLEELAGLSVLPSDLRKTAEARLENPDLSLKELGEMMMPPLGKSGMNHRLNRLESTLTDFLNKKGRLSDGT